MPLNTNTGESAPLRTPFVIQFNIACGQLQPLRKNHKIAKLIYWHLECTQGFRPPTRIEDSNRHKYEIEAAQFVDWNSTKMFKNIRVIQFWRHRPMNDHWELALLAQISIQQIYYLNKLSTLFPSSWCSVCSLVLRSLNFCRFHHTINLNSFN